MATFISLLGASRDIIRYAVMWFPLNSAHLIAPVSGSRMFNKKHMIRNSTVEIERAEITACLQQIRSFVHCTTKFLTRTSLTSVKMEQSCSTLVSSPPDYHDNDVS